MARLVDTIAGCSTGPHAEAGNRPAARATLQQVLEDDPVNDAARALLRRVR